MPIYKMMKDIIMYTGPLCNFCDAAKRLFSRNNLKYKEIDISSKEGLRDEMIKKLMEKELYHKYFSTKIILVDIKN